jgi:hypothetical protein
MSFKRIALAAVVLAAASIVALKTTRHSSPGTAALAMPPTVVLVADGREADTDCGCGQIIRRVRAARSHGVVVQEVEPSDSEAARRYGITVAPTVVFLDPDGRVLSRREGESTETIAAISQELARLEGARR